MLVTPKKTSTKILKMTHLGVGLPNWWWHWDHALLPSVTPAMLSTSQML